MISLLEQGGLVTVFGGSGFVGRHAVEGLALDDEGPALAAAIGAGVTSGLSRQRSLGNSVCSALSSILR
jgi:uncharacterized protein YbjT (DUF2867 family)